MISRGIVGKRIAKIHQEIKYERFRGSSVNVTALELEDGTLLRPRTIETDDGSDYCHDFVVVKPGAKS